MKTILATTFAVFALASPALSKAHDQGVADGEEPLAGPGGVAGLVDNVVRFGLSGNDDTDAPGSATGEGSRADRGGNRVNPVVGRGRNSN